MKEEAVVQRGVGRGRRVACHGWRAAATRYLSAGVAVGVVTVAAGGNLEKLERKARQACAEVLIEGRHSGSAWLATDRGLLVTAGHLFDRRGARVQLLFGDNERVNAVLVALDRGHDLALLRVDSWASGNPRRTPLPLARRSAALGEEVYQYGAPIFRAGLLQPGRVARPGTVYEYQSAVVDYAEVVPLAAMMQGGTSGGPWLDRQGRVVGVQSSVMSLDGKAVGVAFMASGDAVRRLVERSRDASTPTLAIAVDEVWQQGADYVSRLPRGQLGLVVSVVREGGTAARAGVQPRDLLVEFEGRPLVRISDLVSAVRGRRPGDSVELKWLRPGEPGERVVRLDLERVEDQDKP